MNGLKVKAILGSKGLRGLGLHHQQLLPTLGRRHFWEKPFSVLDPSRLLCPETVNPPWCCDSPHSAKACSSKGQDYGRVFLRQKDRLCCVLSQGHVVDGHKLEVRISERATK